MVGDVPDIQSRLRVLLPTRWFATDSPNLNAILTCLATPWSWLYGQIQFVIAQSRLTTANGPWLDLMALDFFGASLQRGVSEFDAAFRSRISWALFQRAATRSAIIAVVEHLTGFAPTIFEPENSADTGSYGQSGTGEIPSFQGMAYGSAGGWGNLDMPLQFFITVKRPVIQGVSLLAGYGTDAGGFGEGGLGYVDLAGIPGAVTDQKIANALSLALPINTTAWFRLI